jgi:hypothetical protein
MNAASEQQQLRRRLRSLHSSAPVTDRGYADTEGLDGAVANQLRVAGATVLGMGSYSVVYQHPDYPTRVVKLTLSAQDGYHAYVEWVQAVKASGIKGRLNWTRHLPVVYSSKVLPSGLRVTVLEKLDKYGGTAGRDCGSHSWRVMAARRTKQLTALPHLRCDDSWSNRMYRNDGTCVSTDPWAHDASYGF